MIVAVVVLALVALGAVAVLIARPSGVATLVKDRVVVYTKDERSIRGVCVNSFHDSVAVAHAEYIQEGQPPVELGDVTIPRENVALIQTVTT